MPPSTRDTLLERIFQKSGRMVSRTVAGEVVLVPLRDSAGDLDSIYTLNETGARIWNLLDGKHSLQVVLQGLLEEFEIETAVAEQDLLELVGDLVRVGALEEVA